MNFRKGFMQYVLGLADSMKFNWDNITPIDNLLIKIH